MRISDIAGLPGAVLPTAIEGLGARNVGLDEIKRLSELAQADPEAGGAEFVHALAVDAEGNQFEDLATIEQVRALPMATLAAMSRAISEAIGGEGKD